MFRADLCAAADPILTIVTKIIIQYTNPFSKKFRDIYID